MSDRESFEIGFELGWDLARFGRASPKDAALPGVREGYMAGHLHFPFPQHRCDRYTSKWLQLRAGALRRRRAVDADVTPEYLRSIDADLCPVVLSPLTHATLTDTDWSVDRINNDGAYAVGNLVVLSARANRAKGRKDYAGVAGLACGDPDEEFERLTRRQWARLACLMFASDANSIANVYCGALLTRLPQDCRAPLYYLVQQVLLVNCRPASTRNAMLRALDRLIGQSYHAARMRMAVERLAILQATVAYPYDALADARVQENLWAWFTALDVRCTGPLVRLFQHFGAVQCAASLPDEWRIESAGYLTPHP
jgi:hypothetical protein